MVTRALLGIGSYVRETCNAASAGYTNVSGVIMRVDHFVTGVACCVLLVTCLPAVAAEKADRPPNFVVILCDNLGYGDIEPFGSTVHRTPRLNRMAAGGRTFTHFYVSAGVCTPSRASLMTGCYAQRIGMHDNPRDGWVLRPVSPYGLHPDEITIAEVLREVGYATSLIGKWHLGDQPEFLPTSQGFDEFFGIPYSDDMTEAAGRRVAPKTDGVPWPPLPLMDGDAVVEAPTDRNELTKRYTERAVAFIERHRDQPFFLMLSHAMPGSTREPFASEAFRGRSRNGPWGDAVEEIDWSTGAILDALKEHGIDGRTLVVWTSDNGAPSNRDDLARGTNRPLSGRGYSTSEGAFRVPTIMHWPGHVPEKSACDQLMTTMDMLPTFASLAGAKLANDRTIDGRDASAIVLGLSDAQSPHEAFFYYHRDQLQAVRSGPYKLFLPLDGFHRHPRFQPGEAAHAMLFDVVNDIGCEHDILDDHPEVAARLTKLANVARETLGDRGVVGAEARQRGYVENPTPRVLAP